ncbi:MAG: heme-binding protein [Acidobacteria bacterium]|nr:MAG: heme-binding protein [Acidobacteriota bacterium]
MELLKRGCIQLTLDAAKVMVQAAEDKAREIGVDMDIAVVDAGTNLLCFHRMDGGKITSIDVAINKAFTAAATRLPTSAYAEVAGPGGKAFGIHVSNHGRFMIFGGGVPVVVEGQTIGAIGCSSGSVEQDTEVAQAGIDALLAALERETR